MNINHNKIILNITNDFVFLNYEVVDKVIISFRKSSMK